MTPIVFSDLDDTLFQTARKMRAAPSENYLASEALNGKHSYTTEAQDRMIRWLLETTDFVPVTARTTEALARCRIRFKSFRICTHGAVILQASGDPDAAWLARSHKIAMRAAPAMEAMRARVEKSFAGAFRCWIAEEFGMGMYFCVKSNGLIEDLDFLDADVQTIAGDAFTRHRNDNNMSFIPRDISKRAAVAHVLDQMPLASRRPVLGFGDSLTDLPFMDLCQMMVTPQGSQIHQMRMGGLA